jgi:hypothetical protein
MRDDMDKVIVERPRRGGGWDRPGRGARDADDEPLRQGMRRAHARRKGLNENLAPLKRWLGQQVHRPWDQVYAELSAGIDRRNTVQDHIYTHIRDFVEREARVVDGQVCVSDWHRGWVPLRETRRPLFVHPVTGILLPNRGLRGSAQRRRQARASEDAHTPFAQCVVIDPTTQWHRSGEAWFEVKLALLPADPRQHRFDVLRRCEVSLSHGYQAAPGGAPSNCATYGRCDVYAVSKRQLGRRELRRRPRT